VLPLVALPLPSGAEEPRSNLRFGIARAPATLDPANTNVVSFASYCGRLYVGTENSTGFQVWLVG
jgi:hypothetical protein